MSDISEERIVDEIYDARERGDFEAALDLALRAVEQIGEDPVLRFLAGVCLLDLGESPAAEGELQRAVELDPDDAEFRAHLAFALFKNLRFDPAEEHARRALDSDPRMPEAHEALALVLERRGEMTESDRHFERAAAIDPEGFPVPPRFSRAAFEREVIEAERRLPERFARHLREVVVTVEDVPAIEVLTAETPALDPELLGLFVGVALTERTFSGPGGEAPPRILLFQRNLERFSRDPAHLQEEIAVTLYHELGHYLGLDEEELERIDLA